MSLLHWLRIGVLIIGVLNSLEAVWKTFIKTVIYCNLFFLVVLVCILCFECCLTTTTIMMMKQCKVYNTNLSLASKLRSVDIFTA